MKADVYYALIKWKTVARLTLWLRQSVLVKVQIWYMRVCKVRVTVL